MMKLKHHILTLFFINILPFNQNVCLYGQDNHAFVIHNYPPALYDGDPQNWSITEDLRGVMYFANQNGVIFEYDGVEWREISVPELTSVRSLGIDSLGTIYVGTVDNFGYLAPDIQGNLQYISLIHLLDSTNRNFNEIWNIAINGDEIFFMARNALFRLKNNKIKTWYLNELYHRNFVVHNKLFLRQKEVGIMVLKEDSLKLINGGEQFAGKTISAMLPFTGNKILIGTRTDGLFIYDPDDSRNPIEKFKNKADNFLIENKIYHGIALGKNRSAFATLGKGIIIINYNGEIIEEINNSHSLLSDVSHFLYIQNRNLLWVALETGISKIHINYPLQLLNDPVGSGINDVIRFDNKLYLATGNGVNYLSTTDNLSTQQLYNVSGVSEITWCFLNARIPMSKNGNDSTNILLVGSNNGLFEIVNNRAILIRKSKSVFYLHAAKKDPSIIFIGHKEGLYIIKWNYKTKSWESSTTFSDITTEIRSISEDNDNNIWLASLYDGIYRLIPAKIKTKNKNYIPDYLFTSTYKLDLFTTEHGLPFNKGIRCVSFQGNTVFCTINGLYKYNKSSNNFTPDSSIHPILAKESTSIFRFKEDAHGNVWINADMIFFKQPDNTFVIDTLSLKELKSMRIDAVYSEEDGITWFGGDQLSRYDSNIKLDHNKEYPALIRKVSLNKDSVIFGGANFDTSNYVCIDQPEILKPFIDYKSNSFTFEYTAIFFEDEKNLQFSYMLDNFDKDWSKWSNEVKKEYNNLFEGNYTFKVKAKNIYDVESTVATYSFKVLPPIYRSYLAYVMYIILFALIIYLAIRINSRRLKAINIRLEEQVKDRTKEISKKNKELTEQKNEIELQAKELEKLSIVASETDNAIVIMDKDGNFEWFNNAHVNFFGYDYNEYLENLGSNIIEISTNKNIKKIIDECLTKKKTVTYESRGFKKNKDPYWTQVTLTPVLSEDGNVKKLVSIEFDIKKLKEYEKEISSQRDELLKANATKDKFFSIIAHDLKGPFNILLGFGEILLENLSSLSKEKIKTYTEQIFVSSKDLYNLVENLLEWSRSKRGVIKSYPEKINLLETIKKLLSISTMSATEKNIQITVNCDKNIEVFVDENLISTIFRNLISNAIKFSNENSSILISSKTNKDFAEVSITDSGIGIKKEDLKKLFREDIHFTTKGTRQEKGTGLGLILCKDFVEINGGKIWVDSEFGKGATFTFTIPLKNKK